MIKKTIAIPATVPANKHDLYIKNYNAITHNTQRLFLFACDHKIEHLNTDFYGEDIDPSALDPHHIFSIARQGRISALATHVGLIAHYAPEYPGINYIAKLTGKTDLVPTQQRDPYSGVLHTVEDVVLINSSLNDSICGIGLTLYLGSEYESDMLHHAAQSILHAHQNGLITVLWIYPRGAAIPDEQNAQLIAGATGVANALGADFVKIKPPHASSSMTVIQALKMATAAAGNTGVLCAGGPQENIEHFLHQLHEQIHAGGTVGCATGRNIFQHSLPQAIAITHAIAAIVFDGADVPSALKYL